MELRHLRYFVAVAEAENVTRAAAKLHVAQPSVSRQIHDLEEELGVILFQRSAKSLRLTAAGRLFLAEARAVLRRTEEAIAAVRAAADGNRGELRVGYAPSLTVQIFPRALRRFHGEAPGVQVTLRDLSTDQMFAGINDGSLDVALRVEPTGGKLSGLRFEELARFPICVAVAPHHGLARLRSIALAKIVDEPLIAYSQADYPEYHDALAAIFRSVEREPQIAEEHDSVTSLIAADEAGRGIALVPSCMTCMAGPRLKILALTPAQEPVVVGAVYRANNSPSALRKFIEAARPDTGGGT